MNILIIGSGQIGGSIAMAANAHKAPHDIILGDRSDAADILISRFKNDPAVGPLTINLHKTRDFKTSAGKADLVILATSIAHFSSITATIAPHLKSGTIITDVGSVKKCAIDSITKHLPENVEFVPAHPTVGKSGHGPASADPALFHNKKIVTVPGHSSDHALNIVEQFWHGIGGIPFRMNAETHDRVFAAVSHLVHAVSFSLMSSGRDQSNTKPSPAIDFKNHSGNFLRDMTRFTNTSADMWVPIFIDNRDFILESANDFRSILKNLQISALGSASIRNIIHDAHDYIRPMQSRPRETLAGDLKDAGFITGQFNEESRKRIAKTVTLPAFLAAAITLHARNIENKSGFRISEIANPSFKDATRAMMNDPEIMAAHFRIFREASIEPLEKFTQAFDKTTRAITSKNTGHLADLINSSREMRLLMPPVRKPANEITGQDAEPLRPEYVAA